MSTGTQEAAAIQKALKTKVNKKQFAAYPDVHDPKKLIKGLAAGRR